MEKTHKKARMLKAYERHLMLLNNSLRMYENTLDEMVSRGIEKRQISLVKDMMLETKEEFYRLKRKIKSLKRGEDATFNENGADFSRIVPADYMIREFEPFRRNRFIFDFRDDEITPFYVESAKIEPGILRVTFRDCEKFIASEYFEKKKKFDDGIKIYLLNPCGKKAAVIEFTGVVFELCDMAELTYTTSEPLTTEVVFTYANKKVRIL